MERDRSGLTQLEEASGTQLLTPVPKEVQRATKARRTSVRDGHNPRIFILHNSDGQEHEPGYADGGV